MPRADTNPTSVAANGPHPSPGAALRMEAAEAASPADLQALLASHFAPWVQALGLRLAALDAQGLELALPVRPALLHIGGVVCGQALMAAADTAMVLAIAHDRGHFQPMTTVQMQTSFLRAVPEGALEVRVRPSLLRRGRRLQFGEVRLQDAAGVLVAHVTTTCTLL